MQKIRNGRYIKTIISDEKSHAVFNEVDNLDTKDMSQAENNYEKVFVTIRNALESNEQFCCDDEQDRLALTQIITDSIKQGFLICRD